MSLDTSTAGTTDLATIFNPKGTPFTVRVDGDYLRDEHICHGDQVICDPRGTIGGDAVLALVTLPNGQQKLRRWEGVHGGTTLQCQPPVDRLRQFPAAECHVAGVVIGVLRSYRN